MQNALKSTGADPMADFPGPDERPKAKEVLIFDGNCGFCRANVRRLQRFVGSRLAYLSLHDPRVERDYPDLSHERLMSEMVLVDQQQQRHGGAAAVRYLSRKSVWLWPLALLLHIPFTLPLWQRIYQWIAVRRYRLSGKQGDQDSDGCNDGTCAVHFGEKDDS